MEYSTIIYEKKNRAAGITLNRPEALNAMNAALREEVIQALDDIEENEEIDVLTLSGIGRAFCTGMDLKEVFRPNGNHQTAMDVWERIRNLPIPTICAVNGYALTGGLELALACDIIIASENAKFGDTHAVAGIVPGSGMTQILPRLIGPCKAKELSFTGNFISAQQALQYGLLNRVVPADKLQSVVEGIVQDILSCNQAVVRKVKYLINEGMKVTLERGFGIEIVEWQRWFEGLDFKMEEATRIRERVLQKGRAQK